MGYCGGALYFNSYVHNINDEAVTMFFMANKRNVYPTTLAQFIKEIGGSGEKELLFNNPGTRLSSQAGRPQRQHALARCHG